MLDFKTKVVDIEGYDLRQIEVLKDLPKLTTLTELKDLAKEIISYYLDKIYSILNERDTKARAQLGSISAVNYDEMIDLSQFAEVSELFDGYSREFAKQFMHMPNIKSILNSFRATENIMDSISAKVAREFTDLDVSDYLQEISSSRSMEELADIVQRGMKELDINEVNYDSGYSQLAAEYSEQYDDYENPVDKAASEIFSAAAEQEKEFMLRS